MGMDSDIRRSLRVHKLHATMHIQDGTSRKDKPPSVIVWPLLAASIPLYLHFAIILD
jgi:hypothetical protein